MCLLVVRWEPDDAFPLVIGANRDERLDRPATALAVLSPSGPRILGGRDHLAGGTWLAVNETGVVAGLTNQPSTGGRDPAKRSRGELPVRLASQPTAARAVEELLGSTTPGDYNPVWLVVGDRTDLFFIDLCRDGGPAADRLAPGLHVMENRGLGAPSAKVDRVTGLVGSATADGTAIWDALPGVLGDHTVPDGPDGPELPRPPGSPERPPEIRAACVHTDGYGTRSSTLVRVPRSVSARPEVRVAPGPPCTTAFVDGTALWAR
jgi:uncharacterized protein with NRDE domain